ncbi:MFS transporter [Streptomyces sp. NPDC091281]|uniref:MFS transporter n=1 Tax=Streptomyces sp. NPDC091281 TaxID=3365985 RepID=UPI00382A86EC
MRQPHQRGPRPPGAAARRSRRGPDRYGAVLDGVGRPVAGPGDEAPGSRTHRRSPQQGRSAGTRGRAELTALSLGVILNPLNSSTIAVALPAIENHFDVSVADALLVVSLYYLAGIVAQPLAGRLVDVFGPRSVFVGGIAVVGICGAAGPFAGNIGVLVALRAAMAAGASVAYPAAIAHLKQSATEPPVRSLAILGVAANVSSAAGPLLGGVLVALYGWQVVMLVNLPFVAVALWLARGLAHGRAAPLPDASKDGPPHPGGMRGVLAVVRSLDLTGGLIYTGTLVALVGALQNARDNPPYLALCGVAVGAGLLWWWSRRRADPFFDPVLLVGPVLRLWYGVFTLVHVVFYVAFYGTPLWLEEDGSRSPGELAVLMLPLSLASVIGVSGGTALVRRWGYRTAMAAVLGSTAAGAALLLVWNTGGGGLVLLLTGTTMLGLSSGLVVLVSQARVLEVVTPDRAGTAGGLMQTCRGVGAIAASTLVGLFLSS